MMSMRRLFPLLFLALTLVAIASEGASRSFHGRPFVQKRALQECNAILASWSKDQVYEIVQGALFNQFGANSTEATVASYTLLPAITYGVQVRRLCASCSDFPVDEQPEAYASFCSGYGSNTSFSGLLMIPLAEDGSFLPGTHAGNIYCHGTSTQSVPTTEFQGESLDVQIMLNLIITSTGAVTLMPDYMGYGESSGTIYKAYLVKQQYQTSIIPLWLMADRIIQTESDCTSALAAATAVLGYSEGGYAAVALAEGLDKMGVDIIKVEAGAGPYRMASAVILTTTENTDLGTFPSDGRHYFALVGAAYSSTYPEVPNFDQGQDMLASQSRSMIVELVTNSSSTAEVQSAIPVDDPLSIFSPELLSFVRGAIVDGDSDPCNNADRIVEGVNDKLCDALKENDLNSVLETSEYPVRLCHSPDDEVVSFENLPDFDKNVLLEFLESSGTHFEAAVPCLLQAMLFMLSSDFQDYPVEAKDTGEGCPAPTLSPAPSPLTLSSSPSSVPESTKPHPAFASEASSEPTMSNAHRIIAARVVYGSAFIGTIAALV